MDDAALALVVMTVVVVVVGELSNYIGGGDPPTAP